MSLASLLEKELPQGKFWTHAWSLVEGCTPVSPGCKNCWLAGMYSRNLPNLTSGLVTDSGCFNGTIVCRKDRLDLPLGKGKPKVYAVWSDLGHENVDRRFRLLAFSTMKTAEHHRFIVVTKRPKVLVQALERWTPLGNVIILVTMEDQMMVDERAPYAVQLASMGWKVGALCEPLLKRVDLTPFLYVPDPHGSASEIIPSRVFSWIIAGGESGSKARPVHPEWIRSLKRQAWAADIPFLFKQWGEWEPVCPLYGDRSDEEEDRWANQGARREAVDLAGKICPDGFQPPPGSWLMEKVGKNKSGRRLNGRWWDEVPDL